MKQPEVSENVKAKIVKLDMAALRVINREYDCDTYTDEEAYKLLREARLVIISKFPFYGFLGMDVPLVELPPSPKFPTAVTNGKAIFYNPKFIHALKGNLKKAVWLLCHELDHINLDHAGKTDRLKVYNHIFDEYIFPEKKRPEMINIAQDIYINNSLHIDGIGVSVDGTVCGVEGIGLEKNELPEELVQLLETPTMTHMDLDMKDLSTEQILRKMLENRKPGDGDGDEDGDGDGGFGGQSGGGHIIVTTKENLPQDAEKIAFSSEGEGEGGSDSDTREGSGNPVIGELYKDSSGNIFMVVDKETMDEMRENAEQRIIGANDMISAATEAGFVPYGYKRVVDSLKKPTLDFKSLLRSFISKIRVIGMNPSYPNKNFINRGIGLPSQRNIKDRIEVAFAIDTSGSISNTMIAKFLSEGIGVLNAAAVVEATFFCFDGDVDPKSVSTIEIGKFGAGVRNAKKEIINYAKTRVTGGGGTNFDSVWKYMEKEGIHPDVLVFLTDGYPFDNNWHVRSKYCPTIFVVCDNPDWKAPFGKTCHI